MKVLRLSPFALLLGSRLISLTGTGITTVALALLVAPQGPTAVGILLLAQSVPRFGGPLAGAFADRIDQRSLLALCELGQAVLVGFLAFALPPFPVVVSVAAASSCLATLFAPAGRAAVPQLVTEAGRIRAYALLGTALNLQLALGPILGGLLVTAGGPRWALGADASTFLISALLLTRLPGLPASSPSTARPRLIRSSLQGLIYVARTRVLRTLAVGTFLVVAFAAVDNVALLFLARDELHAGSSGYGLLLGSYGTAMLLVSLGVASAARRLPGPAVLVVLGVTCTGGGLALTGLAPDLAVALATQAVAGAGNSLENVASDRLVQLASQPHLLGRAFGSIGTAAFGGQTAAYILAGPLVALTSPRWALTVAGMGALLALPLLVFGLRRTSSA